MLVDDYGGYKVLFSKTASPCTELGCWAHARRKFFDLHQANASTVAYEALQRIGGLYAAEAESKHLSTEAWQLTDTLEKLLTWPNSRIDQLLPFAPEHIEALMKECG